MLSLSLSLSLSPGLMAADDLGQVRRLQRHHHGNITVMAAWQPALHGAACNLRHIPVRTSHALHITH